jgi:hypothetical protein
VNKNAERFTVEIKNIYVDIDDTICSTEGTNYEGSIPIPERIAKVNSWHDEGAKITYWTSRGCGPKRTKADRKRILILTTNQLMEWGCKYYALMLDKPLFDCFIDDKAISSNDPRIWL